MHLVNNKNSAIQPCNTQVGRGQGIKWVYVNWGENMSIMTSFRKDTIGGGPLKTGL